MTVTGLNSNYYYSDNPIYLTFSGINTKTRYIEFFPMGVDINPIRLYVSGQNELTTDISQLVKLAFPDVPHNTDYTTLTPIVILNNWIKLTFVIKEVYKTGQEVPSDSITKTFIKGGKRTYSSNQSTSVNTPLSPSQKLPQWGGYPIDYYYMSALKQMTKTNVLPRTGSKEIRKVKGCDPLYIKFRNLQGGYSYWLF